jgi:fumarylpyruvate hydrolase
MVDYVIPPPAIASVPVAGGGAFPVRRVFCVGRNYADHAREMGSDPDREPPFFFMKPADALLTGDADMPYPPQSQDLHHEMELVVALGSGGADIAEADALRHVWGYAAGLDMTRRDLQGQAKKEGKPWDMGKGFDHSAPIGLMAPAEKIGHPADAAIVLKVNGKVRQSSDLKHLIWSIPETIV